MRTRIGRRWTVSTAIAVAMGTVAVTAPAGAMAMPSSASPAGAAPATAVPRLNWSRCYREISAQFDGLPYECATAQVPVDYDAPNGATMQLALLRVPARDPEHKIGSIFLNPGGPGGSGVDFALDFGPAVEFLWGPEVRDRFDIVGFDPRGVGRSTPLRCFGNLRQSTQVIPPVAFPMTTEEEAFFEAADALLAEQCSQRGNKPAAHMSTANVARDLDLLRAAVGDAQLNYVGLSYGSFLGTTYANMFPDNVRSVVVDGVLDPIAWVNAEGTIPFSTRLRSDEGAQETLDRFFVLCDEPGSDCAFGPDSAQRFADLTDRLRTGPIVFTDPFSGEEAVVGYQDVISGVLGALYDPFIYRDLAVVLAAVEAGTPAALDAAGAGLAGYVNKRGFPHYPNFVESFPAVACEDSNNPNDYAVWSAEGAAADAEFGYFGRPWTWASSPCAQWPLVDADRFVGPFTADTDHPVLVIGNLYDPATRYEGAQTVHGLLGGSALLTVDVPGHTSLGLSLCAGAKTGEYLVDPAAAADIDGDTCGGVDPFHLDTTAAAAQGQLRHQLLSVIAGRAPG
jgi:pimeloyl-ACP methyl ester carboxylesterase